MGQQDYWFFCVIDNLVSQVRLIVENQCYIILTRQRSAATCALRAFAANIVGRNDRKFVPGNIALERDAFDPASRDVAAHGCAV